MLDFQQKRKIRNLAYNKVVLILLLLVVLVMAHSTWRVYNKKRVSEEMKDVSVKNVDELRLRNRELEDKISRLDTRSGIEEEIRLKFNVVKSDENMVVVVEDEKRGESATSSELSLWQKIKNFFTNN